MRGGRELSTPASTESIPSCPRSTSTPYASAKLFGEWLGEHHRERGDRAEEDDGDLRLVAEAEEKAATERTLHEKHEARVIKAERELQEAMQKCETLEQSLAGKESELSQARQAASDARGEAQGALKEI